MSREDPLSAGKLTNIFRTSPKDPLRIINREGTAIEFKESFNMSGMAQYFKTIAAFANNSGGYIIFGVGDKPRRLVGLKENNLVQFENIKVEEFTKNLLEYFSPEIKWNHCTFEYKDMSFGVIYTYPLLRKPCICKKVYDDKNSKYALKEGDIYYRYGGRSERIHYEELNAIIDSTRKAEEKQWIEFIKKVSKIGVENAGLLDLNTGVVSGGGGSVVIDEDILSKIAFVKEGEFVEINGIPTLRVIGNVQDVRSGRIVVRENTKRVIHAIEPNDIIRAFLEGSVVEDPLGYIKTICSYSSAYFPLYYFLAQASKTKEEAIRIVEDTRSRGRTKEKLLERLNGKMIPQIIISASESDAARKKRKLREKWLNGGLEIIQEELNYSLSALMSLNHDEIIAREKTIRHRLLEIYEQYYESASSTVASDMRKAICRIDEILFFARTDYSGPN